MYTALFEKYVLRMLKYHVKDFNKIVFVKLETLNVLARASTIVTQR